MSVDTTHAYVDYISNGILLTHPVTMRFYDQNTIYVSKIHLGVETVLTYGVDFTVTGGGTMDTGPGFGNVVLAAPIPNGDTIRIKRILPISQATTLNPGTQFTAKQIEMMEDKGIMIDQQINALGIIGAVSVHGTQPGGTSYHPDVVRSGLSGFMNGTVLNQLLTHVEVVAGNPHGSTYSDVGAAPASHHGGTSLADHPEATTGTRGFMSAADKSKLNALPLSTEPLNSWVDDFTGPGLDTSKWTRSLTAVNPVASVLTTPGGVYRELTDAGSATSAVILRSTGKLFDNSWNPLYETRCEVGATGGTGNIMVRFGLTADPTVLHGADINYAYFWWDGTTFRFVSRAGSGVEDSTAIAPIGGMHKYRIEMTSSGILAYVDGVQVASHTKVPAAGIGLERFHQIANLTAVAHSLDIDYVKVVYTHP